MCVIGQQCDGDFARLQASSDTVIQHLSAKTGGSTTGVWMFGNRATAPPHKAVSTAWVLETVRRLSTAVPPQNKKNKDLHPHRWPNAT